MNISLKSSRSKLIYLIKRDRFFLAKPLFKVVGRLFVGLSYRFAELSSYKQNVQTALQFPAMFYLIVSDTND